MKRQLLCMAVALATAASVYGCLAKQHGSVARVSVVGQDDLTEALLLVTASHAQINLEGDDQLQSNARQLCADWLEANWSAHGGRSSRVIFVGPRMARSQYLILKYPEMDLQAEVRALPAKR